MEINVWSVLDMKLENVLSMSLSMYWMIAKPVLILTVSLKCFRWASSNFLTSKKLQLIKKLIHFWTLRRGSLKEICNKESVDALLYHAVFSTFLSQIRHVI